MGLTLLLTASAAGVVQPDSCEGDCKGARAQVLLQTGSVGYRFSAQGFGDKFQGAQRLASMSLYEEAIIERAFRRLTSGEPLTGIQKEIIERLNETFVTETLPELQKRHDSDQQLLNEHAAGIAHCDQDLEDTSQSVATPNSEQSSLESAHTESVAQEGSLQGKQKTMQDELTAYLMAIQPPSSVMPEQRAPTPDMDNYIAQNLEFFGDLNSSYASLTAQQST
ncbi:unnamed protein product, partial [Polarella glacialis]